MISGGETRLALVALSAVLMTAACTTGTTGAPAASTQSPSVAGSPAFPSESVPPGVEKDSVLDLNSTKDMTGIVTTVSFADSPYAAHLPDICSFIPDNATQQLNVDTKRRGFRGTQLVTQACSMQHLDAGDTTYSVTVSFLTNNFQEATSPSQVLTIEKTVAVTDVIKGSIIKLQPSGPDDETFRYECGTVWGTFFGTVLVNYRSTSRVNENSCARSLEAAKVVAPYIPKSPSEMRPTP